MLHHFDGRWVGVSPAASRPSSAPRPPRGYELLSGARRLAYIGGYVAWGLIFLAAWVEVPPRWRQSAPTLLVIAVLSTILALVGPRSWRAWSTLADEDAGLCGIIATAVSLALLVSTRVVLPARQARTGGAKRCTSCRYDLTGNVTGICPECGTPVAEVAGASS